MPQDLTLIGLVGRAGTGKDRAADHLCAHYGFVRASFAEAPRTMLEALTTYLGVDHAWLHERALKERSMPIIGSSYRHLMQTLGTEWGRMQVDMDLWVRALEAHLGLLTGHPVHDRIVVTDVRYPNEAQALERHGAVLVGVARPSAHAVRGHTSEDHVGTLWGRAHTVLINDSSLPGLHGLVDGLMAQMQLAPRAALDPYPEA